jgi:hypothetical protein
MRRVITAREAAAALGGQATSATSLICPGPGHSPHDRSLSVRLDPAAPDGFTCHSFAGDDWRSCRDHVRAGLGLGLWRAIKSDAPDLKPKPADDGDLGAWGLRLWGEARDAKGTLAERYLAGRGLDLDDRAREALRFHPSCPFGKGQRHPCIIALFRDLRTDKAVAIQRTALTPEGEKIDRMMAGPVAGAAVKLDPDDCVTYGLAIAEGVESALAARRLFRPTWALGSAGAIRNFPVLGGLEALTIFADADPTGQEAAEACAARYRAAGFPAEDVVILTSTLGNDANDAIRGAA